MIKNNVYVEQHTLELTDEEYKEFNALFSNLGYGSIYHNCLYVCKALVSGGDTNRVVKSTISDMNSNFYIQHTQGKFLHSQKRNKNIDFFLEKLMKNVLWSA